MSGSCNQGNTLTDISCVNCKSSCGAGYYLDGSCNGLGTKDTIACNQCSTCPAGLKMSSSCDGTSRSDVVSCSAAGTQQTAAAETVLLCMDYAQPQAISQSSGSFETGGDVYGPNFDCYWFLNPSSGTKLIITFSVFQTEPSADYFEVFACQTAPSTGRCMQPDARTSVSDQFSGSTKPSKLTLDLTSNGLLVHFHSDASICFAGFKASFCVPGVSCVSSAYQLITFAVSAINASMTFQENTAGLYGDFMATEAESFEFYGNEDHSYIPGDTVRNTVRVRDSFNQTVVFANDEQPLVDVEIGYKYQKTGVNGSVWASLGSGAQYSPSDSGLWNFSNPASGAATATVVWYFTKSEGFVDVQTQPDSTGVKSIGQVIIHTLIPPGVTTVIGGLNCSQSSVCQLKRQLTRLNCLPNQTFQLSGTGFTNSWTTAMTGSCNDCAAGKYVLKLNGITVDDIDSCQTCPDGADCLQGNLTWLVEGVQYDVRIIPIQDMHPSLANRPELNVWQYQILSCPAGHSLINSTDGTSYGTFSHDKQSCDPCQRSEYIVSQREKCQTCPSGATCNGSSGELTGNEGSIWRREGDRMRVYMCLPGYVLVRDDSDDLARALFDSCQQCLPLKYSTSGAQVFGLAPCSFTGVGASPYSCPPLQAKNVVSYSDVTVNGSWTVSPELAQEKCSDCPSGANCTGGDAVVPLLGFWRPNSSSDSTSTVSRRLYNSNKSDALQSATSVELFTCPPGACLGGGGCEEGREGPVCGLCKPGYAMSSGNCDPCPSNVQSSKIAFAVIGSIAAVVLLYFFSFKPMIGEPPEELGNDDLEDHLDDLGESLTKVAAGGHDEDELNDVGSDQSSTSGDAAGAAAGAGSDVKQKVIDKLKSAPNIAAKLKSSPAMQSILQLWDQVKSWMDSQMDLESLKNFALGYIKVIISFYQVLSTYVDNYKVTWPIRVVNMFQYVAIFRFDMISFPGPNCVVAEFSYTERLLIYTVLPVVIITLLCIAPTISACLLMVKRDKKKEEYSKNHDVVIDQFWYSLLFCLFLLYPTVSVATLRSFNCQDLGPSGVRLMADYSEMCPSGNFIFYWAAVCTAVYPVGVPLFFILVMRAYRIPQIAEGKLNEAKVDALVIAYKKRATPVEVEILIRQLRVNGVALRDGPLMDLRIDMLFHALALHGTKGLSDSLSVSNFVAFFVANSPLLGLPNPDKAVLKALIEAKDTSGDGSIDRDEFREMMHQMVTIQGLFTGHEAVDDMHYDQLSRLYEFHKTGEIYLENAIKRKESSEEEGLQQKAIRAVTRRFAGNSVKPESVKPKIEELLERLEKVGPGVVQQMEYIGAAEMMKLQGRKDVRKEAVEALQQAMVEDLRKRVLVLANEKALDGTIAIPTVLWSSVKKKTWNGMGPNARRAAEEEERAIKRIGFLTKNYKVQFWYFELLEMVRKLLMTSIVTFIYTGTPAQISAALVITLAFCLYTQRARPFAEDRIGDMQVFALVAQAFTLIYGLMLTIDELTTLLGLQQSFTQDAVRTAMGGFVVFLNSAVVAFPWAQKALDALHAHIEGSRRANAVHEARAENTAEQKSCREAGKWNSAVLDAILAMHQTKHPFKPSPTQPQNDVVGPAGDELNNSWKVRASDPAEAHIQHEIVEEATVEIKTGLASTVQPSLHHIATVQQCSDIDKNGRVTAFSQPADSQLETAVQTLRTDASLDNASTLPQKAEGTRSSAASEEVAVSRGITEMEEVS